MKNRRQYDLVVFGAEPCGLAAAACAARAGAKCAVIETGFENNARASVSAIPNFVWRKLDLHETNLKVEPVTAKISLFESGEHVTSYENDRETQTAIEDVSMSDGALWPDFKAELECKERAAQSPRDTVVAFHEQPGSSLVTDHFATESLADMLADYFEHDGVKAHFAALAAMTFGLGGEEPGSSLAMAAMSEEGAWRIKNGERVKLTLERLCEREGVDRIAAGVKRIDAADGRAFLIELEGGETARSRAMMASSTRIAQLAGLKVQGPASPLAQADSAEAMISLKMGEMPKPPVEDEGAEGAIYYIAETPDEIRRARDAVLEGRTPDNPPLSFEFGENEIVIRAPYCPRAFESEEGPREWTGQDRQLFAAQVLKRIAKYFNGGLDKVEQTDVRVIGALDLDADHQLNLDAPAIEAPPPAADEIGAAAKLALKLVANG